MRRRYTEPKTDTDKTIKFSSNLIAMTVSTNYHKILKIVLESNLDFFDHWIVVTNQNDLDTIRLLNNYPKITILKFKFSSWRRPFNKGGGIRYAQKVAYEKFPESWYLILDSDICLSSEFSRVRNDLNSFDKTALYGAKFRRDFASFSDFQGKSRYYSYDHGNEIHGYFQMYWRKYFYSNSHDASWCDLEFERKFENKKLLDSFFAYHLGNKGNWTGKKSPDFEWD